MTQLDGRTLEVLTLELQGETFALEATQVYEILDQTQVTEVPGSDPFISGLVNVRGKVVPLADLRLKFDMPQTAATIDSRIVVIDVMLEGEAVTVGILADKVNEVTELTAAVLQETPKLGMKWRPEFIRCIGKRGTEFIAILDIDRIFSDGEGAGHGLGASTLGQSAAWAAPGFREREG
jgi:purine-binding chemotaxis protein CheW